MINPSERKDRFVYSEVLAPPKDCHIVYALGTTYSLNITALVSCMIPLAFKSDTESEVFKNNVSTYVAFRKLSSKMIVFCDKCQIKPLGDFNKNFISLLENIIFPVEVKSNTTYHPAFHPKIWLIKFANDFNNEETFYRLAVMSRNISFDHSYDVSYILESSETNEHYEETLKLIDFLKYLKPFSLTKTVGENEKTLIDLIIEDLIKNHICFKIQSENDVFTGKFNILPLYDEKSRIFFKKTLITGKTFENVFLMSPFINEDSSENPSILKQFAKQSKNTIKCISAGMTINELNESNGDGVELYRLNPALTPNLASYSEDKTEDDSQEDLEILDDIHAKIYLTETKDELSLFAGSVNATWAAMNINDEFMIKAELDSSKYSVQSFFDEINPYTNEEKKNEEKKSEFDRFFIPANFLGIQDKEKEKKNEDNLIKLFCFCNFTAICEETEKDIFNITLKIISDLPAIPSPYTIKIKLASMESENQIIQEQIVFQKIPLQYISDFYELTLYKETDEARKRIIKIDTCAKENLERRNQIIQNNIFSESFSIGAYLSLMLDNDSYTVAHSNKQSNLLGTNWGIQNKDIPFYDAIMKAAAHYPDNVLALKKDLNTLKENNQTEKCSKLIERVILAIELERGLVSTNE